MSPLVIKLGGAALSAENATTMSQLFCAIAEYQMLSKRPITIVHGGGYLVDELMEKLQLPVNKRNGLRVTPYEQIPFIAGALAGTANKMLQGQAIKDGLNAVGLCLADGGLCQVSEMDPELGAVGEVVMGDATILKAILSQGALPIISSIGLTADGQIMNVNADQAAVAVAQALNAELILLSDVVGVLDGNKERITSLNEDDATILIDQGVITDGMIVKVQSALKAAKDLGNIVEVATWKVPENLPALLAGEGIGTRFLP
ncbi:acetylglutamate kinase [Vibrio sp.]|nr:acetylglutamate kinase [Vibrio sp.]